MNRVYLKTKNFLKKLARFISNNKVLFATFTILFLVLVYCHFNTFLGNDDLPYSFFKRLHQRVTTPFQIIWDNLRYYKSTNGRFIVHCIVMSLLVFGKNLWSIMNPLIIIFIIILSYKIVVDNKKIKDSILKLSIVLFLFCSFISMYNFKEIIYWVAGSVNYVWICFFILVYCYLYLYKDILNKNKVNYLLLFILSTLHENSFAFFMIFAIVLNVIDFIKDRKFKNLKMFIPILLGGAVLLLSPGNLHRVNNQSVWNSLSLFGKLNISIPFVSKYVFGLFKLECLIPTVYIILVLIKLINLKHKSIITYVLEASIVMFGILSYNNYFRFSYFILAIIMLLSELWIHLKEKNYSLIPIQFGFYAIAFSMIITPLYNSLRPNLLLNVYFSIVSAKFLFEIFYKNFGKKIIFFVMIALTVLLIIVEINIYTNIGMVYRTRLKQIEEFKKNPSDTLVLAKIPSKYERYHQDCNVVNETFWTYDWFIWYYDLPEGIRIIYK